MHSIQSPRKHVSQSHGWKWALFQSPCEHQTRAYLSGGFFPCSWALTSQACALRTQLKAWTVCFGVYSAYSYFWSPFFVLISPVSLNSSSFPKLGMCPVPPVLPPCTVGWKVKAVSLASPKIDLIFPITVLCCLSSNCHKTV